MIYSRSSAAYSSQQSEQSEVRQKSEYYRIVEIRFLVRFSHKIQEFWKKKKKLHGGHIHR